MFDNPVEFVLQFAAFLIGACVGSFLNVCIYRWPLDLKVDEPKRSFCPQCKSAIPVWRNIPMVSWVLLRGKCADCKAPIPVRYVLVELLTALGFLGLWVMYPSMLGVALIFFFVCCMVTVWVDFEHYIIPDQVSIKAVPIGLLCAALAPQLFDEREWYRGFMWGAIGAVTGYLLLWGVVELGKKAFGKKKIQLDSELAWKAEEEDDGPVFTLGDEKYLWVDLFARPTDRLIIETKGLFIRLVNGESVKIEEADIHLGWEVVVVMPSGQKSAPLHEWTLEEVKSVQGKASKVVIPREAMGFGDVKFLALAGCFVGWQGVLFTVAAASLLGTVLSVLLMGIGLRGWTTRIPFGPYLVAGAWIWIFAGWKIIDWYFALMGIAQA